MGVLSTKVELYYDGEWHTVSGVRGITASDGEIDYGGTGQEPYEKPLTSKTSAALSNVDGTYSPENANSPLYGKLQLNTPIRVTTDIGSTVDVVDSFDTNGTSGWPDADSGHTYTVSGGSASDYYVSSDVAYHEHNAVSTTHSSQLLAVDVADSDITFAVAMSEEMAGSYADIEVKARVNADYVSATVRFNDGSGGSIQAFINTDSATATSPVTITGLDNLDTVALHFSARGRRLKLRVWDSADNEPTTWDVEADTDHLTAGSIHINSTLDSSVTNTLPIEAEFVSLYARLGTIVFTGYVSEWPQIADKTCSDMWTPLVANGVSRRLTQGNKRARSPLNAILSNVEGLQGYWSFEDLQGNVERIPAVSPVAESNRAEDMVIYYG